MFIGARWYNSYGRYRNKREWCYCPLLKPKYVVVVMVVVAKDVMKLSQIMTMYVGGKQSQYKDQTKYRVENQKKHIQATGHRVFIPEHSGGMKAMESMHYTPSGDFIN